MAIKHLHQVQASGMPKEYQERLDKAKKALSEGIKKLNEIKKRTGGNAGNNLEVVNQKDAVDALRLRVKKAQRGQQ